jgi:hypothetical protein
MSDGPLGTGVNYYAAFQITGNLDQACLKSVLDEIRKILGGECGGQKVNGQILKATRIAATTISRTADGQLIKAKVAPKININID